MRKASGILEIPYFEQDDAGTYECVAENSKGKNSVQGKLSFYGGFSPEYFGHDKQYIYDNSV